VPPRIIAHRGASGHACENSPSAFRRAVELGADGVELDVHATSDGALLVHHDPEVASIGTIGQLPAGAFHEYRLPNGESIPTLGEALELLPGLEVWVELKTLPARWDGRLLAVLDAGPCPWRYGVHAFDHRIIARLGEHRPELRRGVLMASYLLDNSPVLRAAGADTLWMEAHLIDAELVHALHEDGFEIIAWTADEAREIHRLSGLGVDAICGNYPDRIRAALR
jgi:glycerophosphoryl diester phosphodiesterase